jgi:hypothetical protein
MGIVDDLYIQKTEDKEYKIGQHIVIFEDDILKFCALTRKLSAGLYKTLDN